jgi:uncharacterized membrane protein HdeD (DUF308 family)
MTASHAGPAGQVPNGHPVPDGAAGTAGVLAAGPAQTWGRTWQLILFVATATFVVGLILLVWPKATINVVAVLIGIALLLTGLFRLIEGFTAHDASGGTRAAYVIIGLLAAVAGLYCLRHLSVTVILLGFIVGVFWVLHGIVDLIVALTGPGPGRLMQALVGVVSLAAGLVVMFWPSISLTILLAVIGIWLMFYGLMLAVMAFQFRRLTRAGAAPA